MMRGKSSGVEWRREWKLNESNMKKDDKSFSEEELLLFLWRVEACD